MDEKMEVLERVFKYGVDGVNNILNSENVRKIKILVG
jgi:hypothetical protein